MRTLNTMNAGVGLLKSLGRTDSGLRSPVASNIVPLCRVSWLPGVGNLVEVPRLKHPGEHFYINLWQKD